MAATIQIQSEEERLGEVLLRSARQGDWTGMAAVLEEVELLPSPRTSASLHDRARCLEEALTTAKSIRADMAASLVRLSAAATFSRCQNSGGSPKY